MTRDGPRAVALAALLALSVVAGVAGLAGSAAATQSSTITASPDDPGATSTHRVVSVVGSDDDADSWNNIVIDYSVSSNPADISDVGQNDVTAIGIDSDADGTIEESTMNDLSSASGSASGEELTIGLDGSSSLNQGDQVIVEYQDAQNPGSEGTYDVEVAVNTGSSDNPSTASLSIQSGSGGGGSTPTPTPTPVSSDDEDDDPTYRATGMKLVADGTDVDLQVTTTGQMSGEIYAEVDGAVDKNIVGGEFEQVSEGETYTYVADVSEGKTGTFDAQLTQPSSEYEDTLSVGASGSVDASMSIDPAERGASSATHTFRISVGEDASTANHTLEEVAFAYDVASASGSVTSVSDDQNVARFEVRGSDGTVRRSLGDTDQITVNVDDGEVQLDVSGVDGNLKVHEDETIVVELQPVTNPSEGGTYDVGVSMTDAMSNTDTGTASFSFGCSVAEGGSNVATQATSTLSEGQASAQLGGSSVQSVAVDTESDGQCVAVRALENSPVDTAGLSGSVVSVMNVSVSGEAPTTVTVTVPREAFESDPSGLTIARYHDGSWNELETSVESKSSGQVTVEADAPGTSLFAVTSPQSADDGGDSSATATATPEPDTETESGATATATPEPDTETTETTTPGFGVVAALAGLVIALGAAYVRRR